VYWKVPDYALVLRIVKL